MFNNPYLNGFNMPMQERQQPIQNIFTGTNPSISTNDYFMARILKPNEQAETQIVTQRTAFIDLNNKKLSIKEIDGSIANYEIILPLDEKDKKIIALENQINELKEAMNNVSTTTTTETNTQFTEPITDVKKPNRK